MPIDGTFPDYQRVIPQHDKPANGTYTLKTESLIPALESLVGYLEPSGACAGILEFGDTRELAGRGYLWSIGKRYGYAADLEQARAWVEGLFDNATLPADRRISI